MPGKTSSLWKKPSEGVVSRLENCLNESVRKAGHQVRFFFRADDIGIPGKKFFRLMDIFLKHKMPLCFAVVPCWFSTKRWKILKQIDDKAPQLWCWHQHGWSHKNHEPYGKKQEFGKTISAERIKKDILKGREKLEKIMENRFTPVFTPPWNRMDTRALTILKESGFKAVSRQEKSDHDKEMLPEGLLDFSVNVDLHTRREVLPEDAWEALFDEFSYAVQTGICGVMIHHQLMNSSCFDFLEILLKTLTHNPLILPVNFDHFLNE